MSRPEEPLYRDMLLSESISRRTLIVTNGGGTNKKQGKTRKNTEDGERSFMQIVKKDNKVIGE